jgi:hypothetical protein
VGEPHALSADSHFGNARRPRDGIQHSYDILGRRHSNRLLPIA